MSFPTLGSLLMNTPPTVEPVTTVEAKAHMRVDIADDDTLIAAYIKAARVNLELITGRRFMTQTWTYYMDRFPGNYGDFPPPGLGYVFMPAFSFNVAPGTMPLVQSVNNLNTISLPIGPVTAVTEVKVYDSAGTGTIWASSNYVTDLVSLPARIVKKCSVSWPNPALGLQEANAVQIKFVVGEALAATVPEDIKTAIKLLAAHFYMNREGVSDLKFEELPMGISALIAPYRTWQGAL